MTQQLSNEIISLIHHVELNESGWWKKATGQVLKGVMWKHRTPLSIAEIKTQVFNEIGYSISDETLEKLVHTLEKQQSIIKINDKYKLTEESIKTLSAAHDKALDEQKECEKFFISACTIHLPDSNGEIIWKHFKNALNKNIKILGANLYHLISDGKLEKECDWSTLFLSKFDESQHPKLKSIIQDFFAPANKSCRSQLLQMLSAHFFAEATQLSEETIKSIESGNKKHSVKVVLDTNFIFSILNLHENPGNEPSLSLLELSNGKDHILNLKLYALPSTLEETKNVLSSQQKMVEQIRTTLAISRAAQLQPIASVAKKFFKAAEKTPGLTAENYFGKYITSLEIILKGKGIQILDAHPSIYNKKQEVIDDIIMEQKHELSRSEDKRKGYETLQHDVVLWHAVNDRRPSYTSSPFEIEYWAVSNDWRLIDFDRRKNEENKISSPTVLHPSNLIQFLQFWVPRTAKLDEILIDSLNLPVYFNSYDRDDEKATITILTAISHYENNTDLTEDTIKEILTDKVLKNRIKTEQPSQEEAFGLVHEEILKEHKQKITELDLTKNTLEETKEKIISAETKALEIENKNSLLEEQSAVLAKKLAQKSYLDRFILLPTFIGLIIIYFAQPYTSIFLPILTETWQQWAIVVIIGLLPLLLSSFIAGYFIKKNETLSSWWVIKVHQRTKQLIISGVGIGLVISFKETCGVFIKKIIANL